MNFSFSGEVCTSSFSGAIWFHPPSNQNQFNLTKLKFGLMLRFFFFFFKRKLISVIVKNVKTTSEESECERVISLTDSSRTDH